VEVTVERRYYVAIDDTDHESDDGRNRGTGSKSRALARELIGLVEGRHLGITRHQLLVDPAIPYTSHNSSACIVLGAEGDPAELIATVLEASELFLTEIASPGADVGLLVAEEPQVTPAIVEWGTRAKVEVLSMDDAFALAEAEGVELRGLTGDRVGVVGALAAAGLRRSGADGRFLELGSLRGLVGEQPAGLFTDSGVAAFLSDDGVVELDRDEPIAVGHRHAQPVLRDGRPVLLVERDGDNGWRALPRELVKRY
jgi:hypothetical protein